MSPAPRCPACGAPVRLVPDNPWRPFCSERCKLIDLGDWMTERHRIPAEEPGEEPAAGPAPGNPPH